MRLSHIVKSAAFRLTLLYAVAFELCVAALFAVIYFGTAQYVRGELESEIERELATLHEEFRAQGLDHLIFVIRHRVEAIEYRQTLYLLQDARGARIVGNLAPMKVVVGWVDLPYVDMRREARGKTIFIRSKTLPLPEGAMLAVGQSTSGINDVQALVIRSFAWAALATLLLALAVGAALSLRFVRRVDAIERTTREIMDGNLARRLPVRGTGDEFDRLSLSLNRMLERLQSLMEGLTQVTNDIAHDLRTPLARLRQRLEGARLRAKTTGEYEAAVDEAMKESDAILRTFSALLRIAQIESGARRAGFAEVDLSGLVSTLHETYAAVAEDRGQTIAARIEPGIAASGDRDLLTQMLVNLIENALTHTPSGTRIELQLARRDGGIVATVADNGPGIPAAMREKVFRRFHRLDASRSTEGSGLGLSLVAAIADLHGIKIELGDGGPGLVVTLRFPQAA